MAEGRGNFPPGTVYTVHRCREIPVQYSQYSQHPIGQWVYRLTNHEYCRMKHNTASLFNPPTGLQEQSEIDYTKGSRYGGKLKLDLELISNSNTTFLQVTFPRGYFPSHFFTAVMISSFALFLIFVFLYLFIVPFHSPARPIQSFVMDRLIYQSVPVHPSRGLVRPSPTPADRPTGILRTIPLEINLKGAWLGVKDRKGVDYYVEGACLKKGNSPDLKLVMAPKVIEVLTTESFALH